MSESKVNLISGIVFTLIGGLLVYLFVKTTVFTEELVSNDGLVLSFITISMGIFFLCLGGFLISVYNRKERMRMWLRKKGIVKIAKVTGFRDSWRRFGNFYLEELVLESVDGEIYYSEGLNNRKLRKKYSIGDEVEVAIHPDDSKIYDVRASV